MTNNLNHKRNYGFQIHLSGLLSHSLATSRRWEAVTCMKKF